MHSPTHSLPRYIIERLRRRPPEGDYVVRQSTPVLSFGDSRKAKVATLGLNPSRMEFLDQAGGELEGNDRRLETFMSLGVKSLHDAPIETLQTVVNGCNAYFLRRPYGWFKPLEQILKSCGASYYDGSACHLDLVQWATDPVWRKLPKLTRQALIADDAPFLNEQLQNENIALLLLNGMGVIRQFSKSLEINFTCCDESLLGKTKLLVAHGPRRMQIVGWSTNLQSSFGVTKELRHAIAQAVAALVNIAK